MNLETSAPSFSVLRFSSGIVYKILPLQLIVLVLVTCAFMQLSERGHRETSLPVLP